jgi:dienelactone hydrolase
MPNGLDLLAAAPDLYRRAMTIPAQIQTAMAWVAAQDWADPNRVSLLGFSLGALAAPAAQRLGPVAPGWTVLAYGGTPLGPLIAANPHLKPRWVAPILSGLADLALRPLEPGAHLPHLRGRFLVLEGRTDEFVPAAASSRFRELTPAPKRVVTFEGGHMGVGSDQIRLLERIIAESRAWLIAEGAANAR